MKTYKVELVEFPDGVTNPEVMDLVNVKDSFDRIMCAPDEFIAGEVVTESDFYIEKAPYVDDYGVGSGDFAFKKLP